LREKESRTFQVSFYKGKRIRRLIAKNGKPLSPNEQAKEDKNVEKLVTELENKEAKKQARIAKQSADEKPQETNVFRRRTSESFKSCQSAPRAFSRARCNCF
jgi:hypothetical protein